MALFIGGVARLARDHGEQRVTMACEACSLPRGVLICHAAPPPNLPRFLCVYPFLTRFSGQFWRPSGAQNRSCSISPKSSRRLLSNDIKFT
jgi:hypothetical protein